jgi:hypothetical protein
LSPESRSSFEVRTQPRLRWPRKFASDAGASDDADAARRFHAEESVDAANARIHRHFCGFSGAPCTSREREIFTPLTLRRCFAHACRFGKELQTI